ncbi:hypothetical protein [Lactobacillus sp.]|uniref:hypothetical protein n=1 Tax=Lactobacillus sp. TaxID=1591 RepID=UPI00258444AF|nr:hypothetical protein [Lactobacillus sp.]MCO6530107.1 hypothetical protein [Lactobacillus sp.]
MNKTSQLLLVAVLALSGIFFYFFFEKMANPIITTVLALILTYFSIWIIYSMSQWILKIVKRSDVKKKTELLNTMLIISIISFLLLFSSFVIDWNETLLTIVSDLTTALGYFYFASQVEKTTPKIATIYSLSIILLQSLFFMF